MREEEKEIEMPSTLAYNLSNKNNNFSSTSNLSSLNIGEKSDQPSSQSHTLIFNDHPHQTSQHHHLNPSNSLQHQQPHRSRDPDPTSLSPIPQPQTTTLLTTTKSLLVRYRECQKNHAASMGGHVTDGCGEFIAIGEENSPQSFTCAACNCHRNFHRKEIDFQPKNTNNNSHSRLSSSHVNFVQPMMVAFGESSSEDLNNFQNNNGGQLMMKKRFRTKFTPQQKDKMMEFAEKLGWRIQKQDDLEVQQFCSQVGVKRHVFKVWMHNSKQAIKKKQM